MNVAINICYTPLHIRESGGAVTPRFKTEKMKVLIATTFLLLCLSVPSPTDAQQAKFNHRVVFKNGVVVEHIQVTTINEATGTLVYLDDNGISHEVILASVNIAFCNGRVYRSSSDLTSSQGGEALHAFYVGVDVYGEARSPGISVGGHNES